jgi:hypothetical protein
MARQHRGIISLTSPHQAGYLEGMRTTLSLDDDVAVQLSRLRKQRHVKLRDVANEALRLGLRQMTAPRGERAAYRTKAVSLGRCLIGIDDVAEALATAEGEGFR